MPTIAGLRRRGYTPEAIRDFCARIGVAKKENVIDVAQLEHSVREDLNRRAPRVMAVLRPLKVVIDELSRGPGRGARRRSTTRRTRRPGTRQGAVLARAVHRARRLHGGRRRRSSSASSPGTRGAAALRVLHHVHARSSRTRAGEVVELRCTYDPATRGGDSPDGRKVKATIHWVSAAHAVRAEVRLYDRLFPSKIPSGPRAATFLDHLNPRSLEVAARTAGSSRAWPRAAPGSRFQFERSATSASTPIRRPGAPCSTAPCRCATPGPGSPEAGGQTLRGISHRTIRSRAGRARDSVHRGVLRRVPPQEDRRRNRRAPQRTAAHLILLATRLCPTTRTVVPVSFKVAHEIRAAGARAEAR